MLKIFLDFRYNRSYTTGTVKTAISIPDRIFKSAEGVAKKLGISRSELYTRAVSEYISGIDERKIIDALNAVYSGERTSVDKSIYKLQYSTVKEDKEEW